MADQQITVIARILAKNDQAEVVRQELEGLIEPTREESGCIEYILHQNADNPAEFLFYETWTSKKDLDDHLQKPHLVAFAEKAESLLAQPLDVQIFKKIK